MKLIKRDIKGSETCKRNEVCVINSQSILGIMDGDFPEWLLIEVLIRLPVKFIFRSKLVCKHWLSLISDPSFARMYISRASPLQSWVIVSGDKHCNWAPRSDFFLERESKQNIYSRELKCVSYLPVHHQPEYDTIEGISNGLMLCSCQSIIQETGDRFEVSENYYICNPITGQQMVLPPPASPSRESGWGFLTQVEDGMLKSFRVVCLGWDSETTKRFSVFFSESGEWKDFSVESDIKIDVIWGRRPVALHGNLHWLLCNNLILAYDPYQKLDDLRVIPLPPHNDEEYDELVRENEITSLFGESGGKLRYIASYAWDVIYTPLSCFKFWILNDYGSGDWSLQNRIEFSDISNDIFICNLEEWIYPILFDPVDSDIVYLGYRNVIVSYNVKTKTSEVHGQLLSDKELSKDWFSDSTFPWRTGLLFSIPPWPTSIPFAPTQ